MAEKHYLAIFRHEYQIAYQRINQFLRKLPADTKHLIRSSFYYGEEFKKYDSLVFKGENLENYVDMAYFGSHHGTIFSEIPNELKIYSKLETIPVGSSQRMINSLQEERGQIEEMWKKFIEIISIHNSRPDELQKVDLKTITYAGAPMEKVRRLKDSTPLIPTNVPYHRLYFSLNVPLNGGPIKISHAGGGTILVDPLEIKEWVKQHGSEQEKKLSEEYDGRI